MEIELQRAQNFVQKMSIVQAKLRRGFRNI